MNEVTGETTVGEIVRAFPARSRIFENLGIDYCCGGKTPLGEACRSRGLDRATVIAMLCALNQEPGAVADDPAGLTLSDLCDHIERVHHDYLREELPRLDFMTRKVAAVHGEREPRLIEIRRTFEAFNEKMSAHTAEEEARVFPAIRQLDSAVGDRDTALSSLQTEFAKLETEHSGTGAALARFRKLTDEYTPPEWSCNTYRALFDGLQHLEKDLHQHIHKENNVLFPRALAAA